MVTWHNKDQHTAKVGLLSQSGVVVLVKGQENTQICHHYLQENESSPVLGAFSKSQLEMATKLITLQLRMLELSPSTTAPRHHLPHHSRDQKIFPATEAMALGI